MMDDEQDLKKNTGKGTQAIISKENSGKPQTQARMI